MKKKITAKDTMSVEDIKESVRELKKNQEWQYAVTISLRFPFIKIQRVYFIVWE